MISPIHPFVVHFPIALLIMGWGLELLARVRKRPELSRAGWFNQATGTIGVIAAAGTGLWSKGMAGPGILSERDLALHEQFAFAATTAAVILFLWRIARRGSIPPREERAFLLFYTLTVVLIAATGYFGGAVAARP